jgi:RNA polymerase sigma factor (sigma-70 family)
MTACLADTERYPATAPQGRTGSAIRPTTNDLRDVFLQNQALIEDVIRGVTRRYLLSRSDAEEFASIVRLRLIEDDSEVLRSFEGRSSLRTFLMVVVARLCLDYRNSQWGKWRASTAGQRLGPAVVRLEKLIVRDGLTVSQACEHTNTNADAPISAEALQHLRDCGTRQKRRIVNDAGLERLAARTPAPDSGPLQSDAVRALIRAFGGLRLEDRLVLKLKFCDQLTVADIARHYGLDQQALYRRINRLLRQLRIELEAQGIDRTDLASWTAEPGAGRHQSAPL